MKASDILTVKKRISDFETFVFYPIQGTNNKQELYDLLKEWDNVTKYKQALQDIVKRKEVKDPHILTEIAEKALQNEI